MTHPSTLVLHRYRYGELDPEATRTLQDHLATCPACARRLEHQEQERAAFVLEPVPAPIRALGPRPRRWWPVLVPAVAALAAVALLWVAPPDTGSDGADTIRTKGEVTALEVVAEREGGWVILAPGAAVSPGDRLQLRFDPGPYRYAAFAGQDGSEVVEVYQIIEVEPGPMRSAPFALELDDTPGDQELFAVFSDAPPDPVWLVDALDKENRLDEAVITRIRLRKEVDR